MELKPGPSHAMSVERETPEKGLHKGGFESKLVLIDGLLTKIIAGYDL